MSQRTVIRPMGRLRGACQLPGDKSISHRAFLINALGEGRAIIRGANTGEDLASTRRVLSRLGVQIREERDGYRLDGRAQGLRPATTSLDCGNSGTTIRLLAGILAGQPFTSTLSGDASLSARPMARIANPLRQMGARVEGPDHGEHPPLIITGGPLEGGRFELPVASAQVKSCILLAAQVAGVEVEILEPGQSRDHSERMLRAMGGDVEFESGRARLRPTPLHCIDVDVPADPSGAMLLAAASLSVKGSGIRLPGLLLNPSRAGFLPVLESMGIQVAIEGRRDRVGEAVGTVELRAPDQLSAIELDAALVPGLIDEIPAFAVLAAVADGTSIFPAVGELRVKESDRLAAILELLGAFGIEARVEDDRLIVVGGMPRLPNVELATSDDHRIAMAQAALARATVERVGGEIPVALAAAEVSFPDFAGRLEALSQ